MCQFITGLVINLLIVILAAGTAFAASVTSITATPDSFNEAASPTISLSASITGELAGYSWVQTGGPKVPLTSTSESSASADVSALSVAVDTELTFTLFVSGTDGSTDSQSVSAFVYPVDLYPFPGPDVQIGGSSTAVSAFTFNGAKWSLFNIGNRLLATPVSSVRGPVYSLYVTGFITDIDIVTYNGTAYALLSTGT